MNVNSIEYRRNIEVKGYTDVLVVGGGPSGIAAAVSAALAQRTLGGKTTLIELSGTFGGMSTLAGVPELMNFDDGRNFIARGFGERVYYSLYDTCEYRREWKLVRTERLKRLYDDLAAESGVDFRFYSRAVDVITEDGYIKYVVISSPEGLWALECGAVVDCTGSGEISALAGADYDYGDENGVTMPATLCSLWGGVDFSKKGRDADHYERAYADGVFSKYDTCLPGIKPTYPEVGVGSANAGHAFAVDDRDSKSLTAAMVDSRRQLDEYERFYHGYVPGCDGAVLMDSANFLGIRESRRIRCESTLSERDYFNTADTEDSIGRYSYPIDIHPMTPDKDGMEGFDRSVARKHSDGESYSIPYGALVPKGVDNLLVAGRSIGADRAMQASVRVIPGCYVTGQAAGVGAALCASRGEVAKYISPELIRSTLAEIYS